MSTVFGRICVHWLQTAHSLGAIMIIILVVNLLGYFGTFVHVCVFYLADKCTFAFVAHSHHGRSMYFLHGWCLIHSFFFPPWSLAFLRPLHCCAADSSYFMRLFVCLSIYLSVHLFFAPKSLAIFETLFIIAACVPLNRRALFRVIVDNRMVTWGRYGRVLRWQELSETQAVFMDR